MMTNPNQPMKSNCCNASIQTVTGGEGISYWKCKKCGKPCDLASLSNSGRNQDVASTLPQKEELLCGCPITDEFSRCINQSHCSPTKSKEECTCKTDRYTGAIYREEDNPLHGNPPVQESQSTRVKKQCEEYPCCSISNWCVTHAKHINLCDPVKRVSEKKPSTGYASSQSLCEIHQCKKCLGVFKNLNNVTPVTSVSPRDEFGELRVYTETDLKYHLYEQKQHYKQALEGLKANRHTKMNAVAAAGARRTIEEIEAILEEDIV